MSLFRAFCRVAQLSLVGVRIFGYKNVLKSYNLQLNNRKLITSFNFYNMAPKRKRKAAAEDEVEETMPEQTVSEIEKKTTKGKKTKDETQTKKTRKGRVTKKKEVEEEQSDGSEDKLTKEENSDVEEQKPAKKSRAPRKKQPVKDNSEEEEEEEEVKPAKRGQRKKKEKGSDDESEEEKKPAKKARTTKKETTSKAKAGGDKVVKNQTSTSYADMDFNSCEKFNGKDWNVKISNWNVDGIRAWFKKGGLEYLNYEKPDILCIQETKCSEEKLPPEIASVEDYNVYWHSSKKEGYAGVGLYSKTEPISVSYGIGLKEHDDEGRMITAEYDKYYVISVYVPNAGRGLVTLPKRLEWNEEFRKYVAQLDKKKPVIICGDMNVAHTEIDLSNPKTNTKNAGFTKEEREGMTEFLSDGYIDTFRKLYPDKTQAYTFWTYMSNCRAKNVGWRLDYFIVSERFADSVCDNVIRKDVFGSDHCPITLFLSV